MTTNAGGGPRKYELVEVFVALREQSRRVFAVALIAGHEEHSELHRVHVDFPTPGDAVAHVLNDVLGIDSGATARITLHDAVVMSESSVASDFFEMIGAGFDASFPKGIGDA